MSDSRTSNRDVGRSAAAIYSVGRGMSLRLYWLAMLGVLSLYIGIWLFNFENVYGMVVDDAMHFNMATWASKDWRVIFGVEHLSCYYFHFLFLEVPILSLPFSLPSYNIPFADGVTDKFRFFLLAATLLHIPVALAVGWFAERLVIQRWIALAGMILFVLSPTFVFWTPHPDGRLFELPPFLGMIGLLIYLNDRYLSATRRYRLQFIAGSLLFITLALNYNALFYGACFLVMWWGLALVRFWRRPRFWIEGCCFGAGFVLWFTLGELVGHYGAHTAWSQGHLATLAGSGFVLSDQSWVHRAIVPMAGHFQEHHRPAAGSAVGGRRSGVVPGTPSITAVACKPSHPTRQSRADGAVLSDQINFPDLSPNRGLPADPDGAGSSWGRQPWGLGRRRDCPSAAEGSRWRGDNGRDPRAGGAAEPSGIGTSLRVRAGVGQDLALCLATW